ncbi:transposase [Streptomyces chrestomyceticus]|uniref:transposase n=1 Tax=Streptomyces chrestomyceticus TaxID=68185 RepID=UPI0036863618
MKLSRYCRSLCPHLLPTSAVIPRATSPGPTSASWIWRTPLPLGGKEEARRQAEHFLSLTLSGTLEFPGAAARSPGMLGWFRRPMQLSRCPSSLRPRSGEQVPPLTAQVARASNPDGTAAIRVRDRLDGLWRDEDFADWYPRNGRPGLSPAQLATVSVLQLLLGLSDRQTAKAVHCRIDFECTPFHSALGRSRWEPRLGRRWPRAARLTWTRKREGTTAWRESMQACEGIEDPAVQGPRSSPAWKTPCSVSRYAAV